MQNTRLLRRIVLAVAVAILAMQGIATWRLTERARDAQMAAAEETVRRTARGMEASVNRAFVQVDAMLAGLPAVLAAFHRDGTLDVAAVNRLLRELSNQNFTYRDIILVRADGMPLAAAQPQSRRRRLPVATDTAFVEVGSRGGAVSVAGPVANPATAEWSLFFARNVTVPGWGEVMAVAEVPLHQILALLAGGAEGQGIRMTLERTDGTLFASLPHDEMRIGQRLFPAAASLAPDQSAEFRSRFGGESALIAVRPTLYRTLVVSASLETRTALAAWASDRQHASILSGALAVLLLTVALALNEFLRTRDRVEAERAVARRMVENAIESMTDGFVMFDAEDRLVTCNSRYREFYRETGDAIAPGARFIDIMRTGAERGQYVEVGEDREAWLARMLAWHRGNHPPMERLLPDGRWLLITDRRTPDGGTVGIRTDISALKRAMAALSAARDEAAEAAAAKSRFLARMSHELRTPLNGVLGFAQVLLHDARLSGDQREQIRTMHEAGTHLLHLVNTLLDLSKIEAGRFELDPVDTALLPLLEGCAALLAPEVVRKGIAFALHADPALPANVRADPMRLRQLLLNLLSNAVKFTPVGGRVTLRAATLPDGTLRFEVEDSGPGVPPEKQHMLFQDFVQLGSLPPGEATGTGLGLAISARFATLMGGRIGCASTQGSGALFWTELPLPSSAMPVAPPGSQVTPAAARRFAGGLAILVVDDVKANRDVARAMLEGAGHRVTTVADGPAAIAAVQRASFDAVLMDVHMPGMDGLEATRRIRALPESMGRLPILALTASVQAEQVAACRAAGMDGHLDKPIDRERMLGALAAVAAERAGATDPEPPAEPAVAAGPPLLDAAALERLRAQLGAAAADIISEFIGELRRSAGQLAEASAEERADAGRVRALAHRVLGSARTLGAVALVQEAEALQEVARSGDPALPRQARVIALTGTTLEALERDASGTPRIEPAAA